MFLCTDQATDERRGRMGERKRGTGNKNRYNLILVQQMVANGHRLIRKEIKQIFVESYVCRLKSKQKYCGLAQYNNLAFSYYGLITFIIKNVLEQKSIEVQCVYSIVFLSAVQYSGLVICVLFHTLPLCFVIGYSSLRSTVGPCYLSILYIIVSNAYLLSKVG